MREVLGRGGNWSHPFSWPGCQLHACLHFVNSCKLDSARALSYTYIRLYSKSSE